MKTQHYHVLGVMSGTSLDGIDIAELFIEHSSSGKYKFRFGNALTLPYTEKMKNELKEAIDFSNEKLSALNERYTVYLAKEIEKFCDSYSIKDLDFVCTHGHTIRHLPEENYTLQIGNLPEIATMLNKKVICDFRVQDVALGGQGAPLVPIGDKLLFNEYDYCLNLGGFSNVSYQSKSERIAFDICPVNIVLNAFAEKVGKPYDEGGKLASTGKINNDLLNKLNALPYYSKEAPKSLGLEWVKENIFPLIDLYKLDIPSILATFSVHIATQILSVIPDSKSVLVTGGGAWNTHLIKLLRQKKLVKFVVPDSKTVNFKEALVFGLLGVLKDREEVNCLASVTGAKTDHSSGIIFKP